MKYALLMYADPDHTRAMTRSEFDEVMRKHSELGEEMTARGELIGGAGLALPEDTTLVREDGVSTGPLVPGVEHLTAYYEVDCESPERAQVIAARILDHHVTSVEVRGIHDQALPRS